jgi:hypothetical protein
VFIAVLQGSQFPHIHTAVIHYNETEVKNIYETPVTEEQILGRTLLKSFAIAAAYAQQRFGVRYFYSSDRCIYSKFINTDKGLKH